MKSGETGGVSIGPGDALIVTDVQNDFLRGGSLVVANSNCAYKLPEHAAIARRKRSEGNAAWRGANPVYRTIHSQGMRRGDLPTLAQESADGKALLQLVIRSGNRVDSAPTLEIARANAAANIVQLPTLLKLLTANGNYAVVSSPRVTGAHPVHRQPSDLTACRTQGNSDACP